MGQQESFLKVLFCFFYIYILLHYFNCRTVFPCWHFESIPATYFWVPTGQLRATCFVLSVITFQRCTLPQFLWREYMTAVFCIANMQKKKRERERAKNLRWSHQCDISGVTV